MRSSRTVLIAISAALLGSPLLAACGGGSAPDPSGYVVVADASGSAAKGGLLAEGKNVFAQRIRAMEGPATASFMIFNTNVGSSVCPPLKVVLAWSSNSTAMSDTRDGYAQVAPAKADEYVQCALGNTQG